MYKPANGQGGEHSASSNLKPEIHAHYNGTSWELGICCTKYLRPFFLSPIVNILSATLCMHWSSILVYAEKCSPLDNEHSKVSQFQLNRLTRPGIGRHLASIRHSDIQLYLRRVRECAHSVPSHISSMTEPWEQEGYF